MHTMKSSPTAAALVVLVVLQTTMLGALYTGTPPHPPVAVAPFAIAPFLGASIAIALAAILLGPTGSKGRAILSLFAAVLALVSFGPQKYMDPNIAQIWPAVVVGQCAALMVLTGVVDGFRKRA